MPDEVINRAKEVLNIYETKDTTKDSKRVVSQIAFDLDSKPANTELEDYIDTIDPLNTTPMESISILFKIKEMNKK
jgi:DNA mismatch repair ATPase MutS